MRVPAIVAARALPRCKAKTKNIYFLSMKLMVLDGNSIINRAFYGIRSLATREGIFTNAIYGFLMMLSKLLDDEDPDALCVCFDVHAPTFRHEKFPAYKAQRKPMPEELRAQVPLMKEVLTAMNVPYYELPGWEADDLLGTIGRICTSENVECVIVTGDRDCLQLVNDNVRVKLVLPKISRRGTTDYTPEVFSAEYGFPPRGIIDLKGLWGDPSDNIPGVPGVGEKIGRLLVQKFGTIDKIYENIDSPEISDAVRKKLIAGRDKAELSRDLATIRDNAPIEFSVEKNLRRDPDAPALYALFKKLEFTKFIEKWNLAPAAPDNAVSGLDLFDFAETAAPATANPAAATTGQSTGGSFTRAEIVAACEAADTVFIFADDRGGEIAAFGIAAGSLRAVVSANADADFWARIFCEKIRKVANNVKQILRFCMELGIAGGGFVFDVVIAAYLLDPVVGIRGFTARLDAVSTAAQGAQLVRDLFATQKGEIERAGMAKLMREVEMPLCEVLADMEVIGASVARDKLEAFGKDCAEKAAQKREEIYRLAGTEFNLNSPKQLAEILFEKLALPSGKKKKNGYSTNAEVLKSLRDKHPIIGLLEEFRLYSKLKTLADGFLGSIAPDGRIHTTFNMTVTATGRLSSSNPNLQNVPARGEIGSEMRSFFVAGEGNVLIDADYSQIELRVLAAISGDTEMQNAFKNGDDIHAVTASRVFHVDLAQVTPVMRSRAKAVNFGIVYGIGQFSLAKTLDITREDAKTYIDAYLEKYSGVNEYMKKVVEDAKKNGFVSTLLGRRRAMPELLSSSHNIAAFGERVARNAPIQGTAADIIKIAMLRVFSRLKKEFPKAKLLLQIHDELIVEAPKESAEAVAKILSEEMENAFPLGVPLVAEASVGENWLAAK
ncbi:MAG: DNA polymerase I [Opitutae bacterium]|nr:DNA polymerase I [Opitutae bacterium]